MNNRTLLEHRNALRHKIESESTRIKEDCGSLARVACDWLPPMAARDVERFRADLQAIDRRLFEVHALQTVVEELNHLGALGRIDELKGLLENPNGVPFLTVKFDVPGEGFEIEDGLGEPVDRTTLSRVRQAWVNELEELTT
jgi:hypothetical protein